MTDPTDAKRLIDRLRFKRYRPMESFSHTLMEKWAAEIGLFGDLFAAALASAVELQWVEVIEGGRRARLTQEGWDEAWYLVPNAKRRFLI